MRNRCVGGKCWLAENAVMEKGRAMPPCEGPLVRCHLISRQELRRRGLDELIPDSATWVLGCGGYTGAGGHHGMLDHSRRLRIPFRNLPDDTVAFAIEHDMLGWLERTFWWREG